METNNNHTPKDFIGNKFLYENATVFTIRENGHCQSLVDIRGFGAIQNLFKDAKGAVDLEAATNFQDGVGEYIKEAIESYEALKQQNEEYRAMLEKLREKMQFEDFFTDEYLDIDNLLTKYQK